MTEAFWSFRFNVWTAAAAAALLVLSVVLSVANVRRDRGGRFPRFNEVVRLVAIALLAFTLFRPERVRRIRRSEQPRVAVLCDASGSMATRDAVTGARTVQTRADWLAVQREARFWAPLEERYDVEIADFAAPPDDAEAAATAGTDLNLALEEALQRNPSLRAVLLLSDGDWNTGTSPVAAATRCRMRDIPIFALGIGSDQYLPDLELQSVAAPAYGLLDEHIALPFTVQSRLPRDVRTTVTLFGPSGAVAARDLLIPAMASVQHAVVLVPRQPGEFQFSLRLPVERDEVFDDNNERTFAMALRREQLKVLLVESQPRWEFRYLRNALLRDPGVTVDCVLLHPEIGPGLGDHYLPAFPAGRDDLSTYDVVFLGDIGMAPGQLTEEQAGLLKGLVEQQGSGLVFLPGRLGCQDTLADSALAPLMPVIVDRSAAKGRGSPIESRLQLTARGRDHLLTLLAPTPAENEEIWNRLPGFYWYAPVLRARPGADVLGVHGDHRNEYGRIPLLVAQTAGSGKVLYMGTDAAWRWRRGVEDTYHYRFWGQVVRWMAHQRHLAHDEGIRFFFTPEAPRRGDRVLLHATAFDAAGLPLSNGRVTVHITGAGREETVTLAPEDGGWGVYTGAFVPARGGAYALEVRCEETGRKAAATVIVEQPKLEVVGRPARIGVLKELASITGGAAAGNEGLDDVLRKIRLLPEPQPLEERFRLWCHPLWLALITGLLALYWIGRKAMGKI